MYTCCDQSCPCTREELLITHLVRMEGGHFAKAGDDGPAPSATSVLLGGEGRTLLDGVSAPNDPDAPTSSASTILLNDRGQAYLV